ncbi:MBOAT family O-acyltransferase [Leptospira sp. GIMC2001]|uniref:MBOAT family O-acyltransferase n=1 Tax=Leptospira sp. GIMC2001 TaxID=1513297 RepID=UPI00234A8D5E|nr:MBOAT family O-acyltransferase [Leptospira sp. GIMC2001]WCL48055.1 MBOAT family protein [Leptospira sp. GIMC2001]
MKFTSISFAFFFLLVYILYWNFRGKSKLVLLIIASVLFYSAWSPLFTLHFLAIAVVNYILVMKLFENKSKVLFYSILILDVGNLFFFKYFYLFLDFLFKVTRLEFLQTNNFNGWIESWSGFPSILLPLAISFYSFVFIAYAVDTYNGKIEQKEGFLEYFTFIFYFPHLVAGPIIRHSDFFYQLRNAIRPDSVKVFQGIYLILQGLLKKIVIADNIFPIIQPIYTDPSLYDWTSGWLAVLGFSVRVYCDFSGYTDMARGLSKLLGLELPENFLAPFLTTNVRELWKKWHYTLATWIRDYLYFPMGGSKSSPIRNQFNLFVAFTLGGLWHGANYTYIIWGAWNGFMVAIERELSHYLPFLNSNLDKGDTNKTRIRYAFYLILGFVFTQWVWLIGCAFFNSENIEIAYHLIISMHSFQSGIKAKGWEMVTYSLILTFGFNYLQKIKWEGFKPNILGLIYLFLFGLFCMLVLGLYSPETAEFIYFQF